jgi:hypothetical protein
VPEAHAELTRVAGVDSRHGRGADGHGRDRSHHEKNSQERRSQLHGHLRFRSEVTLAGLSAKRPASFRVFSKVEGGID